MSRIPENQQLSPAEVSDLVRIMTIKYSTQLARRSFELTTKVDSVGAYVTTTLSNADRSFVYPVEGRMVHKEQNIAPKEAQLLLIDYIDHYFSEYFHEDEKVFLPIDWCTYTYETVELQLRGQVVNQKAQDQADELLQGASLEK